MVIDQTQPDIYIGHIRTNFRMSEIDLSISDDKYVSIFVFAIVYFIYTYMRKVIGR